MLLHLEIHLVEREREREREKKKKKGKRKKKELIPIHYMSVSHCITNFLQLMALK